MDKTDEIELNRVADANIKLAQDYAQARMDYAKAQYSLDVILASRIDELRSGNRKNLGYNMAIIELMKGGDKEIIEYHKEVLRNESKYKGLEMVIKANEQKLSLNQSIMRHIKENT